VPHLFGRPPFEAVARRLDHLHDLGIDGLWLCPINATPPGNYGYAVTDYHAVREDYGTAADLHRLIEQAHARGLRVVLDFVPNHTSHLHRFFADAERNARASPYYDFYDRDEDGRPTHYFGWDEQDLLERDLAAPQSAVPEDGVVRPELDTKRDPEPPPVDDPGSSSDEEDGLAGG
jgi:glycosidase